MPAKRTYTDEQLDYIKRYWRKYPTKLVAEQLGMTSALVNRIASRLGLTKNKNKARTPLPEFVASSEYLFADPSAHAYYTAIPNPQPSDYIHSRRPECCEPQLNNVQHMYYDPPIVVPNKPRKNWVQRLVSWLLTGEA